MIFLYLSESKYGLIYVYYIASNNVNSDKNSSPATCMAFCAMSWLKRAISDWHKQRKANKYTLWLRFCKKSKGMEKITESGKRWTNDLLHDCFLIFDSVSQRIMPKTIMKFNVTSFTEFELMTSKNLRHVKKRNNLALFLFRRAVTAKTQKEQTHKQRRVEQKKLQRLSGDTHIRIVYVPDISIGGRW